MKPSEFRELFEKDIKVKSENLKEYPESQVNTRVPCPSCRSKRHDRSGNNLVVYSDGDKHCFACGHHEVKDKLEKETNSFMTTEATQEAEQVQMVLPYNPHEVMGDRGVLAETFKKYGVQVNNEIHVYPSFSVVTGALSGVKTRVKKTKDFYSTGSVKANTSMLFGQQIFPKGCNKTIVITEGELDACSGYQMLSGRFPVVSIPCGSDSAEKCCKTNFDYLNSFETIILNMDMDEAGGRAKDAIANLFDIGKVKVMHLPEGAKDANDMLNKLGDTALYVRCFNNAPTWTPSHIQFGSALYSSILQRGRKGSTPYPWSGLNDMLKGIRRAELTTITAGSGQGKSSILRELAYYLFQTTQEKIGLIYLEEGNDKTGEALISLAINKPIHLIRDQYIAPSGDYITPQLGVEYEQMLQEGFEKVLNNERFSFLNHFGSCDPDAIVQSVRFMAKVQGIKFVFLDHISIMVSSQESGDERKAIDAAMTKLRQLVQETGIHLFLVSHIRRGDGGQEEGEAISLTDLRGSGSIAQLSDNVIAIERDQQAPDPEKRNLTMMRVLKCREIGLTGPSTCLYYNRGTGRLEEKPLETYYEKDSDKDTDEAPESSMYPVLKGAGGFRKLN